MICYRDRTYCDAPCVALGCDRMVSLDDVEDAKRIGLPIAYSDFRPFCTKYQLPPGGAGSTGGTT